MLDLVLARGRVVTGRGVFEASIGISSGKIASISADIPPASRVVDIHGCYVLPGMVDVHTHIPHPLCEDPTTGTMAAAAGGFTTIVDMPVGHHAVSTVEAFREKREEMGRQAVVDFALFAGAGAYAADQALPLAAEGACAFKTFLHPPDPGREKYYDGIWCWDDGQLLGVMKAVSRTGRVHCIHAENAELIEHFTQELKRAGRNDPMAHCDARPPVCEIEMVSRVIMLARHLDHRIHVCHISTPEAARQVGIARRSGQRVTGETCPQYLFLNRDAVKTLGPFAKVNPPLRDEDDRRGLWQALDAGDLDVISTDHAPFPATNKAKGWTDIWSAPAGTPMLETQLPLLLTAVNDGRLTISAVAALTAENPARIFGLYPGKGAIQVGADADFVVVDLSREHRVASTSMYTKCSASATLFDGWEVKGMPIMTLVRGHVIMENGRVTADPGYGQFVKPAARG